MKVNTSIKCVVLIITIMVIGWAGYSLYNKLESMYFQAAEPIVEEVKREPLNISLTCKGCKSVWHTKIYPDDPVYYKSAEEIYEAKKITECPRCPLNICMEGSMMIIALGSQKQLAQSQPDNVRAQEGLAKLLQRLEEHLKECAQCRDYWAQEMEKETRNE